MELSWFESLLYGLISGLTEFLPISAEAHRGVFLKLIGADDYAFLRLMTHIGSLVALLITCAPILSRLNRENKLASISKKRRKRQPDVRSLMDIRFLRVAGITLAFVLVLYPFVHDLYERMWILAGLLIVNGILLYLPQFLPGANKDSRSMSAMDALLVGISGGLGVIPGLSRIGLATSVSVMRGGEKRYAWDTALLLSIISLALLSVFDVIGLFTAAAGITFVGVLSCLTAGICAFISAFAGMYLMRFLSVKVGFSGFAYYSWGLSLFSFILYLMI